MAARVVRELSHMSSSDKTRMANTPAPPYEGATNARGEPHGEGRRVFSSGHIYEGQWVDGKTEGFGRFTYPDGQVFEGQWMGGRRNGPGKLMMVGGETITGKWVDDALSGPVRRYATPEEAPALAPNGRQERAPIEGSPGAPRAAAAPLAMPGGSGMMAQQQQAAAAQADVQWLRESHDVVWQLNVELQMENEKLVAENRRLRLKLRTMLQEQQNHASSQSSASGVSIATAQNKPSNCGSSSQSSASEPPKVVEGRLRRKKKTTDEKSASASASASAQDLSLLSKLLEMSKPRPNETGAAAAAPPKVAPESDADARERRRKIVHELCERAQAELRDRASARAWTALHRLDSASEVERFARGLLATLLEPVRKLPVESDRALQEAAERVREALDAVLGWPEALERIVRHTGRELSQLLELSELHLEGLPLGAAGAGVAALLVRASRQLKSLDLGRTGLGDVGASVLADALRTGGGRLSLLRLHENRIGNTGGSALAALLASQQLTVGAVVSARLEKVDLRANTFDLVTEQALRQVGGSRIILNERELQDSAACFSGGGAASAGGCVASRGSCDVDSFLRFVSTSAPAPPAPVPPPRPSLGISDYGQGQSQTDADAFLNFGRGSCSGATASAAASAAPARGVNGMEQQIHLSFPIGGGGGGGGNAPAAPPPSNPPHPAAAASGIGAPSGTSGSGADAEGFLRFTAGGGAASCASAPPARMIPPPRTVPQRTSLQPPAAQPAAAAGGGSCSDAATFLCSSCGGSSASSSGGKGVSFSAAAQDSLSAADFLSSIGS